MKRNSNGGLDSINGPRIMAAGNHSVPKGKHTRHLFDEFENFKKLGTGCFGLVVRATKTTGENTDYHKDYALKLIPFTNNVVDPKTLVEAERLYTLPDHPAVIRCEAYWNDSFTMTEHQQFLAIVKPKKDGIMATFPSNANKFNFLCIQMELFGGGATLKSWLKGRQQLDSRFAVKIFLEITAGIGHIHDHGLIHRDVKPLNILFDGGKTKISDLGYAANHSAGDYNHTQKAGASLYQSPEQSYGKYGKHVDYYALGLILYELFHLPAQTNVGESLTLLKHKIDVVDELEPEFSDVKILIRQLLSFTPTERPCADKIISQVNNWSFWKKRARCSDSDEVTTVCLPAIGGLGLNEDEAEVACRSCGKALPGLRFKCSICVNFYLCENCEKLEGCHPPVHDLMKIKTPPHKKEYVFGEHSEGCPHYERRCKIQCPDKNCARFFPCRLCHDKLIKGHKLDRKEVVTIQCNMCSQLQVPVKMCRSCGTAFAKYYCPKCTLYDDNEYATRMIFHCDRCGFCRRRTVEGAQYEHCDTCQMCYPTVLQYASDEEPVLKFPDHECSQNAGKLLCNVCGQRMHDSTDPACLASCHHYVHVSCLQKFPEGQDKCPICGHW